MELLGIETSRIIFLMQVHRPSGQLYLPDAVSKLVKRYSFVKSPGPEQALPLTFSIGKFRETQISELSIYNDGFIVSSASDTGLLDAFLDDLLPWATKEFGLVPLETPKPEKFYESSIVVKAASDISSAIGPRNDISSAMASAMKSAQITVPIKLSGFILDFDAADFSGKRKPFRFIVDRRLGLPFSANTFYSQAPFKTKDHLKVLASLETPAEAAKVKRRLI
jgi:hypothetical protein